MNDWLTPLVEQLQRGAATILITVAATQGSTPRETGSKMLVTEDNCFGTVGGGRLEFKAIELAREMLTNQAQQTSLSRRFPLGPSLGQCCGGVAVLWFEPVTEAALSWLSGLRAQQHLQEPAIVATLLAAAPPANKLIVTQTSQQGQFGSTRLEQSVVSRARQLLAANTPQAELFFTKGPDQTTTVLLEPVKPSDFHIVLFGAGHVGRALVQVLSGLPCTVSWIDSREDGFPSAFPGNVVTEWNEYPEDEIDDAPPGSYILIMTHSHALDQQLCARALRRDDLAYCGLIGSATKRSKFQQRLRREGCPNEALAKLTCPIGVDGITGKHPHEIAIAVAAQLLQVRGSRAKASRTSAANQQNRVEQ